MPPYHSPLGAELYERQGRSTTRIVVTSSGCIQVLTIALLGLTVADTPKLGAGRIRVKWLPRLAWLLRCWRIQRHCAVVPAPLMRSRRGDRAQLTDQMQHTCRRPPLPLVHLHHVDPFGEHIVQREWLTWVTHLAPATNRRGRSAARPASRPAPPPFLDVR